MILCSQEAFDTVLDALDQFGCSIGIQVGGRVFKLYVIDKDDLGQIGVGWHTTVSLLAILGECFDGFIDRFIEAKHVFVLSEVPVVESATSVVGHTRQDIGFFIGSKVGLLPRDRFKSGALRDLTTFYKKFRLRFKTSLSEFGPNSNAC